MSRRELPRGGAWRGSPPLPLRHSGVLAARVLAREAVFGGILWGCRSTHATFDIAAGLSCLILALLVTRWFGIVQPRGWMTACWEALPLFVGASCIANILLFLFGRAPWF